MPGPVPSPINAPETGLPDAQWIVDVRDALRDYPLTVSDTIVGNGSDGVYSATTKPIRVSRPPIQDASLLVNVGSTGQTVTTLGPGAYAPGSLGSNTCAVNLDNGEVFFNAAPGNGTTVSFAYRSVKWRDTSILNALYAGLRAMFPKVGKTYVDYSINIQVNRWDYDLPLAAQDPRARILGMEIRDPDIPTTPYVPHRLWKRTGLNQIHIPDSQRFSPIARVRLTFWASYLRLGDLEPQLYHLPILYALGVLISKQEAPRVRDDRSVPNTGEGGVQPMTQATLGATYMRMFENELTRLARAPGPNMDMGLVSSYAMQRYYGAVG